MYFFFSFPIDMLALLMHGASKEGLSEGGGGGGSLARKIRMVLIRKLTHFQAFLCDLSFYLQR